MPTLTGTPKQIAYAAKLRGEFHAIAAHHRDAIERNIAELRTARDRQTADPSMARVVARKTERIQWCGHLLATIEPLVAALDAETDAATVIDAVKFAQRNFGSVLLGAALRRVGIDPTDRDAVAAWQDANIDHLAYADDAFYLRQGHEFALGWLGSH